MDVGFIGVGSMGAVMVPHLVGAGHRVGVWNRSPGAAEALEGVTVLPTPGAAFANDAVLTMLADDRAVREVIVDSGVLDGARPGCVHVMMATISPALAGELAELHRRAGGRLRGGAGLRRPRGRREGGAEHRGRRGRPRRWRPCSRSSTSWASGRGGSALIPGTPTWRSSPAIS